MRPTDSAEESARGQESARAQETARAQKTDTYAPKLRLDQPLNKRNWLNKDYGGESSFAFELSEGIARFLGTPAFIFWLTIFCILWIGWNTLAPESWRFDSSDYGFTALTLVLSLQASYAAPLILLAQSRQAQREKLSIEQDREDAARNLNDTEYILREISDIRLGIQELATRDFVENSISDLVRELKSPPSDRSKATSTKTKKKSD
jgi:uncharacterized membrane protein